MSSTVIETVENMVDSDVGPPRKKWTRGEVAALAESGVVNVERLELIDGELIDTMGKNLPHVNTLHRLVRSLNQVFGIERVTHERPIDVAAADQAINEPEPDIVVLNRDFETFTALPAPDEICLVVEVSATTLRWDLLVKADLSARAGIIEYWVADTRGRRLIVHREPSEGRYTSVVSYDVNDSVTPLAAPQCSVSLRGLFS